MGTRHGVVVDAIVDRIRESQVVEDRVYRDRGATLDSGALPAIDVQLDRSEPIDSGMDMTRHDLRVRVAILARESNGIAPTDIADDVLEAVHRALMTDRTLGGACARLKLERQDWRYRASGDGIVAVCESVYVAIHATAAGDLSVIRR